MLSRILHVISGMKNLEKLSIILISVAKRVAEISDVTAPEYLRHAADELEGK